ncbi:MAG: DUF3370 family protein [Microcoleus sp. Co-bin12]|nr:DUF3370 family protein [Microcoleus sp. Co-bin12]
MRNKISFLELLVFLRSSFVQPADCCTSKNPYNLFPPAPAPEEIVQATEVRELPGQLDSIPLFNSDSPEWVNRF